MGTEVVNPAAASPSHCGKRAFLPWPSYEIPLSETATVTQSAGFGSTNPRVSIKGFKVAVWVEALEGVVFVNFRPSGLNCASRDMSGSCRRTAKPSVFRTRLGFGSLSFRTWIPIAPTPGELEMVNESPAAFLKTSMFEACCELV